MLSSIHGLGFGRAAGTGPGKSHRRSITVMGHALLGGQSSNQATLSGPGRYRPPTTENRQFREMTPFGSVV